MPADQFKPSLPQWGLIIVNTLMWGGFFMVIPLVTVHFIDNLGWAAASIGMVLGVRQIVQQGLTVFGGVLSDRLGPKPLILLGCLIRTAGFAWMAFADSVPILMAAAVLSGIGGSLFDAPKSAAITALTKPEDRAKMFSLSSVAGNSGMVLGPLIGAGLIGLGFQVAALMAASVYLLAFLLLFFTLPYIPPGLEVGRSAITGLKAAVYDRVFLRFTLVMCGYFLLTTQLNVAITLKAIELAGSGATGPLYGLTAGIAVLFQYPLLRYTERHFRVRVVLVVAVLLTGIALGLMGVVTAFWQLLLCVALFSVGSMLVFPQQQTLTARMSPEGLTGSYFGFSALSLGIGGAVGSFLGGALVDTGQRIDFEFLPWLTFAGVSVLTALGLGWALREVPPAPKPSDKSS